jgi:hypothetical protein
MINHQNPKAAFRKYLRGQRTQDIESLLFDAIPCDDFEAKAAAAKFFGISDFECSCHPRRPKSWKRKSRPAAKRGRLPKKVAEFVRFAEALWSLEDTRDSRRTK